MSRLLARLGIAYKRARAYVHSPDRDYCGKCDQIELACLRAKYDPTRFVLVYLDELSFYRHPSVAQAWAAQGRDQARAERSYAADHCGRIVGALNVMTGQLTYLQRSKITAATLVQLYQKLRQAYPNAESIYVVLDNWPVHFHPTVLSALQPQQWRYPPKLPANWPPVTATEGDPAGLPIVLLNLPTYASWLNPIEKLWRWLKQDVLHLHAHSFHWDELKQQVNQFLDSFTTGSIPLLRYVGLCPD